MEWDVQYYTECHVLCWTGACITTKYHSCVDLWYITVKPKQIMIGVFQSPQQHFESLF